MNAKIFKVIAEKWWQDNKEKLATEDIPTVKALIQYYFAFMDAESSIEDSTKSVAFALFRGITGYKYLTWETLWGWVIERYELMDEVEVKGWLGEVKEWAMEDGQLKEK